MKPRSEHHQFNATQQVTTPWQTTPNWLLKKNHHHSLQTNSTRFQDNLDMHKDNSTTHNTLGPHQTNLNQPVEPLIKHQRPNTHHEWTTTRQQ